MKTAEELKQYRRQQYLKHREKRLKKYADYLYQKRQRKGMTQNEAITSMYDHNYFGAMMVEVGDADAFISGLTSDYSKTISPALKVIGMAPGVKDRKSVV